MFIHYNSEAIMDETGYCPVRTYYCESCGGWHVTSQSKAFHDNNKKAAEKAQLRIQHKRDMARRQNTESKLDKVEELICHALGNFRKNNPHKAHKQLQKAFHLFQQTMTSECFKARKLALFSQLSLCYEMGAA